MLENPNFLLEKAIILTDYGDYEQANTTLLTLLIDNTGSINIGSSGLDMQNSGAETDVYTARAMSSSTLGSYVFLSTITYRTAPYDLPTRGFQRKYIKVNHYDKLSCNNKVTTQQIYLFL